MPESISLIACGIWFCVGFFTGAGWAFGSWLIGKITR